ncbi:MAG TPA: serine/threonine-protein kinase [Micromonosporaceae bacterium]|nr:serine/threonine-protein kinase [Micromonosporaceae bacterium]
MTGVAKPRTELLDRRYRLVEPLGRGGMSVVWRGYDEILGRQVAVKVLNARLARDRALRHRIRLEAQAAARLCHPHITNVYDYGEAHRRGGAVPYVVMELVHGESLSARLRRDGPMAWREAVVTAAEVAAALAAAHARGVVHRDVTPGNIMLTPSGAKVVDFGISAVAGEVDRGCDGKLLGTPAYLAPERIDEGRVTPASDVYALGLLLYRSLTGRLPWDAPTTTQMLRAHLYAEPLPVPPVPGLPAEVAQLCERCLAKDPAARPTSAEVAGTLAAAVGLNVAPVSPAPVGAGSDLDADTVAGTTILPWSATNAVTVGRRRVSGDRVRVGAAVAGLAAITGLVWGVTGRTPATGEAAERPRAIGMAAQVAPTCEVSYALRADSGRDFGADLTVTNRTAGVADNWKLTFAFPNDQRITAGRSAAVEQAGRDVVIRPAAGAAGLAPGASAPVSLTGTYAEGNAFPTRFELDGVPCEVQVKSLTTPPAARPSPPVTIAAGGGGGSGDPVTEARSGGKGSDKGSDKGSGKGHGKRR